MSEKEHNRFLSEYKEKINELGNECYLMIIKSFSEESGFAAMCCTAMLCSRVINNLHVNNESASRIGLANQMFEIVTSMLKIFEEDEIKKSADKVIKKYDKAIKNLAEH